MLRRVANELTEHAPFTAFGAITGIIIMAIIVFANVLPSVSRISYPILDVRHKK